MELDCTNAPSTVPSDPGIAGIGVLLSFIIAAAIALLLSASLVFQEIRNNNKSKTKSSSSSSPPKSSILRRKLLNSYSDQQILTGIGIQSVGLAKRASLVPYHFFLVWMLSLLSMAVHNATLLALARDFRRDWVLRWMRELLMLANLVLSSTYGVFVLRAVQRGISDSTLPVECAWRAETRDGPAAANAGVSYVGTGAVLVGNVVIFGLAMWYLHARARRFYAAVQVGGLALMAAFAVGATVRVAYLADAFARSTPVPLRDAGERDWSFGQLLSVGMLLLPLATVVEILRGDIKCAPPEREGGWDEDEGKGRLLLSDEEEQTRETQELRSGMPVQEDRPEEFRPSPLAGSVSSFLHKK
ncbi:uncharacterized protein F4812DRAFT_467523 [Daldinia caldariorum]|uniref:uncharacterized protein n=1 Tax=Daldinia caldariorum TaxID=326644 RepID=UPI002008D159|nr:uncharacterized protein F4812DRAFT_467523 [Daldinia caldariorum]KAI1471447.1 hypothetical protein F4812DRAFT_467523 [Daldinia caldariorum]